MDTQKCPVCNEQLIDMNQPCPRCSYEIHQTFFSSDHFENIEKDRRDAHKEWWGQQEKRNRDKDKEIEDANARVTELEQTLTSKDEELKTLGQEFEEKKNECLKLEGDKDALIDENSSLKLENASLEVACNEKDERIKVLEQVIENLKKHVPLAYLIQKEYKEITNVYPIYKGNTFVGINPRSNENSVNRCVLVAASNEIKETHFSIQSSDDGSLIANRIADDWGIDYEGNNIESCPLFNSTKILIGQQFQLTVVVV